MRLDNGSADAQHRSSADLVGVKLLCDRLNVLIKYRRCELVYQVLFEYALEFLKQQLCRTLGGLERNVAGKAVGHHNVGAAHEHGIALDVADKV